MYDEVQLFSNDELQQIWRLLLERDFSVTEGTAAIFGRTWHFRREIGAGWFLRTWIWERQTEVVLRLGRHDHRGPIGPEHRFVSVPALEAHLDDADADLRRWANRDAELRCPLCGAWLHAVENNEGAYLGCSGTEAAAQRGGRDAHADEVPCAGKRPFARAIRYHD